MDRSSLQGEILSCVISVRYLNFTPLLLALVKAFRISLSEMAKDGRV
jgi:hypothetical protein